MRSDIPSMTASLNSFLFFDNTNPIAREKIMTGQNPFSSGAPESAIDTTPIIKTTNGKSAPKIPP